MFRMLMRYIANNEELVNRLAQSYPMRRAAQMCVSVFYRSKAIVDDSNHLKYLQDMTPDKFKSFMEKFRNNLKQEIEAAKEQGRKKY